MVPESIRKKMRQLEITTRRLLSGSLVGDSRSALKGFGFDFDQIREYRAGDDVRFIDWKSSLRTDKLLVKQYIEERNRRIILAVDVSGSAWYTSTGQIRTELQAQLASVLALVADHGNDAVGLVLFSDIIECVVPPNRGRAHIRLIMEKLFTFKPQRKKTKIVCVLEYLAQLRSSDGIVFLISDFIDQECGTLLRCVARKYDVIALRCLDAREHSFDGIGFITMQDPETGLQYDIDTRQMQGKTLTTYLTSRASEQQREFKRQGIDIVQIEVGKPFMRELVTFFRRRMVY
jgi:uncharacterized protein (DUF58 family)